MDTTHLDPATPTPRAPTEAANEPRSLGDYRILRRLGEGGMGSVYLTYHEGQKEQVAIKVLADHLASNTGFIARFYREARSSGVLNHPNIVRGIGVDQDPVSGKHYLVLEFVDGISAHALLDQQGRLPVGDAIHIALDVARALEHAHSRNIIHRDIKPDNILLAKSGVAKLADFGLAKRTDEASNLTAARQGFGTSYYMPYEQALNARQADGRSDIYALGATLYHLLTGEVPFSGENHLEVVEKKGRGEFVSASLRNPVVPPAVDRILDKMLARDPINRYQTASELIVDFERTRLAAALPTFADPDAALQDPWVRACMTSVAQPTRPDLETVGLQSTPLEGPPNSWTLRFRNREGRWVRVKGSFEQITQRLRTGRMPKEVRLCRPGEASFHPIAELPEFASIKPVRRKAAVREKGGDNIEKQEPSTVSRRRWFVLGGSGALVVVLVALAIFLLSRT
ncbi:MAG TPA: serine/threonine-protein kinase [Gemmataceae bacterium]|nr:serine/threonine-protein kinase [Gemmataceae bacterium]